MTARIKLGRWVLILLGALLILLVSALVVHGGTAQRGSWLTTGFQVVNLGPWTANMSAGFYAPDGNLVYRIDDSLPGGEVRAYHPASRPTPLPDTFTGTLALNSDGQLAAAIIHLEGISETERMGNFFHLHSSIYTPKDLVKKFATVYAHASEKGLEGDS